MMYLTAGLGALVLILAFACYRLWLAAQNTGLRDWAFSLEKQLQESGRLLREQDYVLSQIGELFDHAGVDLERADHPQASGDLKRLGAVLRSRGHTPQSKSPFDLLSDQQTLSELGDRYGIEPVSGGPYTIRNLIQIAEEIFTSILNERASLAST